MVPSRLHAANQANAREPSMDLHILQKELHKLGGPLLFLKLLLVLLHEVTTKGEVNLTTLVNTVKTYSIKKFSECKDIASVVNLLSSISNNAYALNNDTLPQDYLKRSILSLLVVVQTTNVVAKFNQLFENMEDVARMDSTEVHGSQELAKGTPPRSSPNLMENSLFKNQRKEGMANASSMGNLTPLILVLLERMDAGG
eukprot:jgi/Psemu1/23662/gm1.23662_g